MIDQPGKLREIDWNELCPWLLLVRCVRVALLVRIMVLGTLGLIAGTAGWRIITNLFDINRDQSLTAWRETGCIWVWQTNANFAISATDTPDNVREMFSVATTGLAEAPVSVWFQIMRPFVELFRSETTAVGFLCLVGCCIWSAVVWGLTGGAITRIAALELTRGEAAHLGQAGRFAARSLLSYTAAPLMALAAAAVFAIQLVALGLVMRFDVVAMLAAFAWPFVLLLGLLMAILLIGALVGWPFMWATISVEGTDAFDALSRSYAYTYQRPLRLFWYVLVAAVLGALGMFVVKFFVLATIALGDWSIGWGLDRDAMQGVVLASDTSLVDPAGVSEATANAVPALTALQRIAHHAIYFWKSLLTSLAAGFQAGYLWTAAVGIYLLLRRDIDEAELDEVFVDDDEPDYGMPPLEDDPSGVPEVNPTGAAAAGDQKPPTAADAPT